MSENARLSWLPYLSESVPESVHTPEEAARFELAQGLKNLAPGCSAFLSVYKNLGDSYQIAEVGSGYQITGGKTGILYGTYAFLESLRTGTSIPSGTVSPKYALRMINMWDNADGTIERGYAGPSLLYRNNHLDYQPDRMRQIARLMASVGLNVLCINNVNVHDHEHRLLEDWLPEAAELAALFRPFGIRLMFSVDFAHPMRFGIPTADPLDEQVQSWWAERCRLVYEQIPDLAGFLVKADSEHRPGPFTYGRNHAQGANMLARALKPFGGMLVWRCFVYNCLQDWRDTKTDRPMAAYQHYVWLDGQFDDNVILQVKNGPFDFQVREPISPTLLSMPKTNLGLEFQLTQEYTGHQIDLYAMGSLWRETFDDLGADRIMAVAAVGNFGSDSNYFGHPFAAFNLYGFGRMAWAPSLEPDFLVHQWIRLTYVLNEGQENELADLMLRSRLIYEKYTAPLGLCWMVTPANHYGPNPDGYEYQSWGTYHRADRNGVGIDRTAAGTGFVDQYPEPLRSLYADPMTCPDNLKLFFHRMNYTDVMPDGRTLIQRIYDDHFEGFAEACALTDALDHLSLPEPDRSEVRSRASLQKANAREWCDIINSFFYRFSGIPDAHGRPLY